MKNFFEQHGVDGVMHEVDKARRKYFVEEGTENSLDSFS